MGNPHEVLAYVQRIPIIFVKSKVVNLFYFISLLIPARIDLIIAILNASYAVIKLVFIVIVYVVK